MKPLLFATACSLLLASCADQAPWPNQKLEHFYQQAQARVARKGGMGGPVDLDGLKVQFGALSGRPMLNLPNDGDAARQLTADHTSIVVTTEDPSIHNAVEVVVYPAVAATFLDPAVRTPEYEREMEEAARKAVLNNGYLSVRRGYYTVTHWETPLQRVEN